MEEDNEIRLKKVKVAAPDIEKNIYDYNNKIALFFENDINALKEYYELIYRTRPEMIKVGKEQLNYDYDFNVNLNHYDPWEEYKLIYRDIFKRGKIYYILKSIPEWKFLQIGHPVTHEDDTQSKYNPIRINNRDSIFSLIQNERYFDEREERRGTYKYHSQAVRI